MAMTTTAPMLNPNLLALVPLAPLAAAVPGRPVRQGHRAPRRAHTVTILGVADRLPSVGW
jgi:hypothetical protein